MHRLMDWKNNVCKLLVLGYDLCIMKYHVQCNAAKPGSLESFFGAVLEPPAAAAANFLPTDGSAGGVTSTSYFVINQVLQ